jgi:NTE family protein
MAGKRVALALGSGGARGYAHIGVIDELHARGYDIVGIAGSSMGALVGGLEAAGKLDEFADWAKSLTQRAVLRLLDPAITAAGVLRAEKILDAVRDILGAVTIEELPIPYTAVSTDLLSGKSVWLQRGPVDAAIRASIAIPGVITPHVFDGRLLADGGILDPCRWRRSPRSTRTSPSRSASRAARQAAAMRPPIPSRGRRQNG